MSRHTCWIKATHLETGRVEVFRSQTCASEALMVPQQCISASINRGAEGTSYGFKFERMLPKEFSPADMQDYLYSIGFTNWRTSPSAGYVAMADGVYLPETTQIRYGLTDLWTIFQQWQPRVRKERTWQNFVNHFFFMLSEGVYSLIPEIRDEECAAILFSLKQPERSVTVPLRVSVVLVD